jgi:hypothetical protein
MTLLSHGERVRTNRRIGRDQIVDDIVAACVAAYINPVILETIDPGEFADKGSPLDPRTLARSSTCRREAGARRDSPDFP